MMLVAALVATVRAAADDGTTATDIDSLFDDPGNTTTNTDGESGNGDDAGPDSEDGDIVSELLRRDPLEVHGDFSARLGYSGGIDQYPWEGEATFSGLPVLNLSAGLTLRFNLSSAFFVRQRIAVTYPDYELSLRELAFHYSIGDRLFLALGRQRISWGRSPNYPFTDLPNRLSDDPVGINDGTRDLLLSASVPIGVGGVQLIVQHRSEYSPAGELPGVEALGYGAKLNLATQMFDLDVGGYYQRDLDTRLFASVNGTAAESLEVYGEALVAIDWSGIGPDAVPPQPVELWPGMTVSDTPVDFSVGIGGILSMCDGRADLNVEYYRSGEESETSVVAAQFPLFYGHNLVVNVDGRFRNERWRYLGKVEHNFTHGSGVCALALTTDLLPNLTSLVTAGAIYGPPGGGYRTASPDPDDRALFAAIMIGLNGSF